MSPAPAVEVDSIYDRVPSLLSSSELLVSQNCSSSVGTSASPSLPKSAVVTVHTIGSEYMCINGCECELVGCDGPCQRWFCTDCIGWLGSADDGDWKCSFCESASITISESIDTSSTDIVDNVPSSYVFTDSSDDDNIESSRYSASISNTTSTDDDSNMQDTSDLSLSHATIVDFDSSINTIRTDVVTSTSNIDSSVYPPTPKSTREPSCLADFFNDICDAASNTMLSTLPTSISGVEQAQSTPFVPVVCLISLTLYNYY